MILSVVVPTCNKEKLLRRTLPALLSQDLPETPWEIVVVDDGSRDGTPDFLRQISRTDADKLRTVSPGRNVGRASARNLGARAAKGQWLFFCDDDIVAPPGLLAAHLKVLRQHPGCGTIGQVITEPEMVDAPHFAYLDTRGVAKVAAGPVPARYFVTQNAAVPRQAFLGIDGFDQRFSAYGFEDMEVAFRLEDQQGVIFYPVHDPVPIHVHHHTLQQYLDKKRECGRGSLPLIARLHPERVEEMRLNWLLEVGVDSRLNLKDRAARLILRGLPRQLLCKLAASWPIDSAHRPRVLPIYARLMDMLVMDAYHQGLTESAAESDI